MTQTGLVCLGDTSTPSSALSKAVGFREVAAIRQLPVKI
jgi:hypothetical protein